jgi:hypothetical protein
VRLPGTFSVNGRRVTDRGLLAPQAAAVVGDEVSFTLEPAQARFG